MAGIVKTTVRIALIGALVGGAAIIIAGPHRTHALLSQGKATVNNLIDRQIDDPVALREQLRDLEAQYPKRIAQARADLAEVRQQVAEVGRELAIAQRVVQLADSDLSGMKDVLDKAEKARVENASFYIKVTFGGERPMELDEAYAKANRISELRSAYADRVSELGTDMTFLTQQEGQLTDLVAQLETERAEFQAQLWQLDRQVDAIARNQRMITMMEKRKETIDRLSNRYEGVSLDGVRSKLAQVREQQQARLELLTRDSAIDDYEAEAEFQLRQQADGQAPGKFVPDQKTLLFEQPEVVITPDNN